VLPDGRYGVVCYFYDLSERHANERRLQRAVAETELLAREIDHRVKNSLMIVSSLLSMQKSDVISEEARRALAEASDRVLAVARIHEALHKSHQLGIIAFGEYLENMCKDVEKSIGTKSAKIFVSTVPVALPAEIALTLALIANELITNAFKHGVAAGARKITVGLERIDDRIALIVGDDGTRLPASGLVLKLGLGLNLVSAMAQQLSAKLDTPVEGGPMVYRIEIAMPLLTDMAIAA
jgi:two-component sensor histidine kinase